LFLRAFPPKRGRRWRRRCPRAPVLCVRVLALHFPSSGPLKQVKGSRHFLRSRTLARGVPSNPAAAAPDKRKGKPWRPPRQSSRSTDKDRPIDSTSGNKFARKRARTGFEPSGQVDGRQAFMPRVSRNPCRLMLPFRFAHPMRMRPLSVGRVESAFHPAMNLYDTIPILCKPIAQ
jgi:hypothetical protein